MSRHRNVRNQNYEDDYDYDDLAHSVDEHEYGVSPATMAEYMYDRSRDESLLSWTKEKTIEEVVEEEEEEEEGLAASHSSGSLLATLTDVEKAQLNSCMDEVRSVVGETLPESVLQETCINSGFDLNQTLDKVLNMQEAPKPQRQPRNRGAKSAISSSVPPPPGNDSNKPGNDSSHVADVAPKPLPNGDTTTGARVVFTAGKPQEDPPVKVQPKVVTASAINNENSPKPGKKNKTVQSIKAADGSKNSPHRNASFSDLPQMACDASREGMHRNVTVSDFRVVENTTPGRVGGSKKQLTLEDINREYEKRRQTGKDNINLVVIGHVDAGKSTLMGHLLYQLGEVSQRTMHKFEQETKKMGKASFAYAWVLDETEEERTRGVTMDIAQSRFETTTKVVTLLDAPGHKDFIPNMITGAAQADVAVLVANATRGEFETGFDMGGQTREHAMLIRSLGVAQLLVAVNKMDTVEWSQTRYEEITKTLGQFLKQTGFKECSFVPCSGLEGDNLTKSLTKPEASWYTGPTLLQKIDQFESNERALDKPLRLCITDVFKSMGAGISLAGTVQAGVIQPGDRVLVMPQGCVASVKGVTIDEGPASLAFAGDNTVITVMGINPTDIGVGSILCDPNCPIQAATRIQARIVVFNIDVPITKGFPVVFHYQSMSTAATFKRLVSQLNKSSGEVIKQKPRCLTKHTSAVVHLSFESPVCVELYKEFKDLGRFMLRSGGTTIAAGMVTQILSSKGDKTE